MVGLGRGSYSVVACVCAIKILLLCLWLCDNELCCVLPSTPTTKKKPPADVLCGPMFRRFFVTNQGRRCCWLQMLALLVGWGYSNITARRLKRERGFKLPFKNESLIMYYPSNTRSCRKIGNYRIVQRSKQIILFLSGEKR